MQVILLQDISRVGRKHDVVAVSDGHAHNYLIPRGLVVSATEENLKQQRAQKARANDKEAQTARAFTELLEKIGTTPVIMIASASEQGHLFKGLRAVDIVRALSDMTGISLSASAITLAKPIKELGEYPVMVTMGNQQRSVVIIVKGG